MGCLVALGLICAPLLAEEPYWVEPMQAVHARFPGTPGTILRMGDSITWGYTIELPAPYGPTTAMREGRLVVGRSIGTFPRRPAAWNGGWTPFSRRWR